LICLDAILYFIKVIDSLRIFRKTRWN